MVNCLITESDIFKEGNTTWSIVNCQARRPLGARLLLGDCLQPVLLSLETRNQVANQPSRQDANQLSRQVANQPSKLNSIPFRKHLLHCHPRRNHPSL